MGRVLLLVAAIAAAAFAWFALGDGGGGVGAGVAIPESETAPHDPSATSELIGEGRSPNRETRKETVPGLAPKVAGAAPNGAAHLVGRVLDDGGQPVRDALVQLGELRHRTGEDGSFRVKLVGEDLVATAKGHQPAVVREVWKWHQANPGKELIVVLPGAALTITGRLLTSEGVAATGWKLEIAAGTPLDPEAFPPLCAEDVAAGARPGEAFPAISAFGRSRTSNPNRQVTGADGGFKVGGLRRGESYVLRAWNEDSLHDVRSQPILAGSRGVTFVVRVGDERARIYGRVRDRDGAPIPDVRVRLSMIVHAAGGSQSYATGQTVTTNVRGEFAFERVPRVDLLLRFNGKGVASLYEPFLAHEEGVDLDIRLGRICKFQLVVAAGAKVKSFQALDRGGKPLRMTRRHGGGHSSSTIRHELDGVKSPILEVVDDVVELEITDAEDLTARKPVRVQPDRVTVVRW